MDTEQGFLLKGYILVNCDRVILCPVNECSGKLHIKGNFGVCDTCKKKFVRTYSFKNCFIMGTDTDNVKKSHAFKTHE